MLNGGDAVVLSPQSFYLIVVVVCFYLSLPRFPLVGYLIMRESLVFLSEVD